MKKKLKFKIGDIVRYSSGSTALMKITTMPTYTSRTHGGLYHGLQFYGDTMGSYECDLILATPAEIKKFKTDTHIGRLCDKPELAL